MTLKPQSVRIETITLEKLKSLEVEVSGVKLKTYEDKIAHLIWFYESYKNSNSK